MFNNISSKANAVLSMAWVIIVWAGFFVIGWVIADAVFTSIAYVNDHGLKTVVERVWYGRQN